MNVFPLSSSSLPPSYDDIPHGTLMDFSLVEVAPPAYTSNKRNQCRACHQWLPEMNFFCQERKQLFKACLACLKKERDIRMFEKIESQRKLREAQIKRQQEERQSNRCRVS